MDIDRENSSILHDSTATSIEEGDIVEELKTSINGKLRRDSSLLPSHCIFRVPPLIRRQNEPSYVPDVVSIGPYHRSPGGKFERIENAKWWYLDCFLSRAPLEKERLIKGITELEKRARECYAEPLDHLNQKEFLEMLILDGCFLIELFIQYSLVDLQNEDDSSVDPISDMAFMRDYLYHDLLLLENQLPWFVLRFLYEIVYDNETVKTYEGSHRLLIDLVLNFFKLSVPIFSNRNLNQSDDVWHILDLIRTTIVGQEIPIIQAQKPLLQRIPNATSLKEAGVVFKINPKTTSMMNIEFKNGVLLIPPLGRIDGRTGPLFRNLIALEQCYPVRWHKITSYAFLMDNLIDTSKDIDLLRKKGILQNWSSAEDAAKFFNDLYTDTTLFGVYYGGLCNDVNKYYDTKWNKWIAKLRYDYFSTPWAVISFIAAVILLVLTLIQTAFTIHPSDKH